MLLYAQLPDLFHCTWSPPNAYSPKPSSVHVVSSAHEQWMSKMYTPQLNYALVFFPNSLKAGLRGNTSISSIPQEITVYKWILAIIMCTWFQTPMMELHWSQSKWQSNLYRLLWQVGGADHLLVTCDIR